MRTPVKVNDRRRGRSRRRLAVVGLLVAAGLPASVALGATALAAPSGWQHRAQLTVRIEVYVPPAPEAPTAIPAATPAAADAAADAVADEAADTADQVTTPHLVAAEAPTAEAGAPAGTGEPAADGAVAPSATPEEAVPSAAPASSEPRPSRTPSPDSSTTKPPDGRIEPAG